MLDVSVTVICTPLISFVVVGDHASVKPVDFEIVSLAVGNEMFVAPFGVRILSVKAGKPVPPLVANVWKVPSSAKSPEE